MIRRTSNELLFLLPFNKKREQGEKKYLPNEQKKKKKKTSWKSKPPIAALSFSLSVSKHQTKMRKKIGPMSNSRKREEEYIHLRSL
jgi:hypothetical protein